MRKIENKSGLVRVVFMDHKLLGRVSVEVDGQPLTTEVFNDLFLISLALFINH